MKKILFLIAIVSLVSCNSGTKKMKDSVEDVKTTEATINISGMHCENCVASIEKGISALPGIEKVEVTLEDSTAVVSYDASKLKLDEIGKAIEKRGFAIKTTK